MTSLPISSRAFEWPADIVAYNLLGCYLTYKDPKTNKIKRLLIHETEAYMGPHDLACHASKGKTERTRIMYECGGTIYIYLVYGMYCMLNVVTGSEGYPAAVLIRGAGDYDGPGKLTKALGITKDLNGQKLSQKTGIWIEEPWDILNVTPDKVISTPRIGVDYAGDWSLANLRFLLKRDEVTIDI